MNKKDLLNSKKKLNNRDTIYETYGCRHTNPDICANNSLPGICAFSSDDCICKRPPRSWKKTFEELSNKKGKNNNE